MLGSLFAKLGGSAGKYFGGGILSTIGRYAGKYLGNYLERKWFHKKEVIRKYANLKESFVLSKAVYGNAIPLIFGKSRIQGKIIWAEDVKVIEETRTSKAYFTKPKGVKSTTHYTEYKYFLSFAICICEGEIQEITRIWNGDELLDIKQYQFRLYKGYALQMPDPYINSKMNNKAPGFRDIAYIVFENLPLIDFGDVVPNLSFEVTRKANVKTCNMLEDLVKSMIMIPGSGEYVYDTKIQSKQILGQNGSIKADIILNSHNFYNIPNAVHSLNQLHTICKNIEWVAPVVCWFGTDFNLAKCKIMPAFEFKDDNVKFSEEWIIGKYNRNNAHEITKDKDNNPRYGGSVNDASVLRYLQELRHRNLKIMLYPMFFMDVNMKPWRGHLTGDTEDVAYFFNKPEGYNDFILHYAKLVKNHIDAFIIGTELIGLTKIHDNGHNFPAVNELISLAAKVKKILGENVLVSYAADWSEYHHTEGGWFNLDPLWASDNIDFIGIDAYFPITNSESSFISDKDIASGFFAGECYDYTIDHSNNIKTPIEPAYALKNIKYWWENEHKNPDNKVTEWKPKSKKIWFTEYGFPSINKASNQPNVFFDPHCSDGGSPRYSNEEIDFQIQRRCIRAFIEAWGKEEYIENMFLWAWDARPYPAWPHMDIWRDAYLWEKGHWVNDKFGTCSVASIIMEISSRCNLDLADIDTRTIDEIIVGATFSHQLSATDLINTLRSAYFFDITAYNEAKISFVKRGQSALINIESSDLIKFSDSSYINEITISRDQIVNKVDIYFDDQLMNYETNYLYINSDNLSSVKTATLNLPFVLSSSEATQIANLLLKNAASESKILEFNLPISYIRLEPSDFILLNYQGVSYRLRVINTSFSALVISVVVVIDDINNYHTATIASAKMQMIYRQAILMNFQMIDMPIKLEDYDFPYMSIYLNNDTKLPLYIRNLDNFEEVWSKIAMIEPNNSIARIVKLINFDNPNFFLINEIASIEISGIDFERFMNDFWKLIMINDEIIAFKKIVQLEDGIYEISYIIRGLYGSGERGVKHNVGDSCVILKRPNIIAIPEELIGAKVEFKIGDIIYKSCFMNKAILTTAPIIMSNYITNSKLYLSWMTRSFLGNNWTVHNKKTNIFNIRITTNNETYNFVTIAKKDTIEIDISQIDLGEKYFVEIF